MSWCGSPSRSPTSRSAPSVFLKDVAVLLVLPRVQKLPEASLVSFRFFMGGPLKWLQPLPVEVWLHETVGLVLQGRGCVRLPQSAFFFSWMRLRVFWTRWPSIAAFLRCLLSWHPGDFRSLRFGCRFRRSDPWRALSVPFHKWMGASLGDALRFGVWSGALSLFRSFHAL